MGVLHHISFCLSVIILINGLSTYMAHYLRIISGLIM